MARGKCRGRKAQAPWAPPPAASSSSPAPPPPTPTDKEPPINVLLEYHLRLILQRLSPADLFRAAARALPRAPPLLGYFFHPAGVAGPFPLKPTDKTFHPAVFLPLDADAKRVSLALSPSEARGFSIQDVHLGLVLLLPLPRPKAILPASSPVLTFDPWLFEARCVHVAGNVYWHICNSSRLIALDPRTLRFSFLPVPAQLGDHYLKYRLGETPEDGRLCMAALDDDMELQIWVRGEAKWSDRGWLLERRMCINKALHAVPGLPRDRMLRMACTWLSDMDYARTGKVFIKTWGYGRYSFHMETGKLERLEMKDGKEHGHPIWAYTLAWPPAFLAPEDY
ncbi:hypothetical protein ACP70R_049688 [Stipagrostis hirtigluma subsp. patula]